jgi:hypothetical protein
MVPSMWLWLNLVGVILTTVLNKASGIFSFFIETLDVDEHPVRSVGFVAATIGAGGYGVFFTINNVLL